MGSFAFRDRKAKAQRLKAQTRRRESEKRIGERVSFLNAQLIMADLGGRRRIGNTSVQSDSRGSFIITRQDAHGTNRGRAVKVYAPNPADVPEIRKKLRVETLNLRELSTNNSLTALALTPVVTLPKNTTRSRGRALAKINLAQLQETRSLDKNRASRIWELNTTLFNIEEERRDIRGEPKLGASGKPQRPFVILARSQKVSRIKSQSGYDIDKQIRQTKANFGVDITLDDILSSQAGATLRPEAIELFNRNRNTFDFKSDSEKTQLLGASSGFDINKQIQLSKQNFGIDIGIGDIVASRETGGLTTEAKELFTRNRNFFGSKSRSERVKLLGTSSGFDIEKQLSQSNERFSLDLTVLDITKNNEKGGVLDTALTLFQRNRNIDKLKEDKSLFRSPETVNLDEFSDFDTLFGRHTSIVNQQKVRLTEINKLENKDLKIARIEKEIPLFNVRAGEISGLIDNLEKRTGDIRKSRVADSSLISASGALKSFRLGDLVDRRNQLAKFRNEKTDIFNTIKDPALRQVTLEQDIPLLDSRIGVLDSDIAKSVKFGESRKQIGLDILNVPTKGRVRQAKQFKVKVGDKTRTFRRSRRGAIQARQFFLQQRALKLKEIRGLEDPIERAVAEEQDLGVLDFGVKATRQQEKVLKIEAKAKRGKVAGAVGSTGFLPFTPSDTPTGKLKIQATRKRKGVPPVFGQLTGFGNPAGFGDPFSKPKKQRQQRQKPQQRRRKIDPNSFDIGNMFNFGGRETIPKRSRNSFDFF